MKLYGWEFLKDSSALFRQTMAAPAQIKDPGLLQHPETYIQKKPLLIGPGKSKKRILILGGDQPTQGWVIQELQNRKASFVSVNLDEFIFSGKVSISSAGEGALVVGRQKIALKGFDRILYFVPQFLMGLDAHPEVLSAEEKVLLLRWKDFLFSLESLLPSAHWWPALPSELFESSQHKMADLLLAKSLGLSVPDTLMTMDPHEAKRFCRRHKNKVIFREFGARRVQSGGRVRAFDVSLVKPESKAWDAIATSPTIFQQLIPRKFEYRVVVVGKTCFVCRISFKKTSALDWRQVPLEELEFAQVKISKKIQDQIVALVQKRGLRMASLDLVEGLDDGCFYFLELNRPGAWLFVEAFTQLPITDALLDQLLK